MEKIVPLSLSSIVDGETGHPVLLVHDLNASLRDWDLLIPALVDAGYVTYACDLFGHGQSLYPTNPDQYYAQLQFTVMRRWIDSLNLVRAPILIGHGFGAYLCLRYTFGHPYRVFRLVLINPLLAPDQIAFIARGLSRYPGLQKLAELLAPNWTRRQLLGLHRGVNPEVARRVLDEARKTSPFCQRILPGIVDLTQGLNELPTKSLFLVGQDDSLLDMSQLPDLIEDQLDMTYLSLQGLGHRPHLEAPEETNKLIIKYLLGY